MDHARSTCSTGLIHKHVRNAERDMAAFIPRYSGSLQRVQARGDRCGLPALAIPFCAAFQTGRFRRLHLLRSELCGEVSFAQRRGRSHRTPGGSRQPRDRQVRYYSESAEVASRVFGTSGEGVHKQKGQSVEKPPKMPKRHSPVGWRLGTCTGHWPLETILVDRVHLLHSPGRFPLSGFGSCRVLRSLGHQTLPGSLLHHWHPTYSNQVAV